MEGPVYHNQLHVGQVPLLGGGSYGEGLPGLLGYGYLPHIPLEQIIETLGQGIVIIGVVNIPPLDRLLVLVIELDPLPGYGGALLPAELS